MKHKVAELDGDLLDAAVAKAEGRHYQAPSEYAPSSQWRCGGPIIERERIVIEPLAPRAVADTEWNAGVLEQYGHEGPECGKTWSRGPAPLVAAMRAYIMSRFGDEIEL